MPDQIADELIEMVDCAEYVAVNDYEARLLAERTGVSIEAIAARVDALIVTRGGEGSLIGSGNGECVDTAHNHRVDYLDLTGVVGLLVGAVPQDVHSEFARGSINWPRGSSS